MSWTRGGTIGRGSTATVSVATARDSGEVFAVKSAELSQSEALQREQELLSQIDSPQVVGYNGWNTSVEDGKLMYNLCMEYAPGGSLTDVIRGSGGWLDEPRIRYCVRAILLGLEHLHSNGIVHCDIKCQNVLLTEGGVKIADLGCARRVSEPAAMAGTIIGTPLFMAPEVVRGGLPGCAGDVWSLGCTVIEMATGQPPWTDVPDPILALYRIGFSGESPDIPSSMSEGAKDFLSKCLKVDPSERWTASKLLKHDFLDESLDCPIKDFHFPTNASPTSVLDQGVWSSITTESDVRGELLQGGSRSLDVRIQQLMTTEEGVVNWEWDGNWVTVRSHDEIKELAESARRYAAEASSSHDHDDGEDAMKLEIASETQNSQPPISDFIALGITDSLADGSEIKGKGKGKGKGKEKGSLTLSPCENETVTSIVSTEFFEKTSSFIAMLIGFIHRLAYLEQD